MSLPDDPLTPYLAWVLRPMPLRAAGLWEIAGVFQADDARHAWEQAVDADRDVTEAIIVPVVEVYRRAVE